MLVIKLERLAEELFPTEKKVPRLALVSAKLNRRIKIW
jgi:hypothetical protein